LPATSLTETQVNSILFHYPSLAGEIDALRPMPQGMFNENVRFSSAGRAYVLKKLAAGRSEQRHLYGGAMQRVLAESGVPCPEMIVNQDGGVVTRCDGGVWSVQAWSEGHHLASAERNGEGAIPAKASVGSTLGRIHAVALEAVADGRLQRAPRDARLPVAEMLAGVEAVHRNLRHGPVLRPAPLTRLRFKPRKTPTQRLALSLAPLLEQGCRRLAEWNIDAHPHLQHIGPCHGDINWENLLFDGGQLVAILDFDNAMEMSQDYDTAAAAVILCGGDPAHLEAFLTAYEQASGRELDPEALPALMLLKCVRSLLWQIEVAISGGTGDDEAVLRWMDYLARAVARLS